MIISPKRDDLPFLGQEKRLTLIFENKKYLLKALNYNVFNRYYHLTVNPLLHRLIKVQMILSGRADIKVVMILGDIIISISLEINMVYHLMI